MGCGCGNGRLSIMDTVTSNDAFYMLYQNNCGDPRMAYASTVATFVASTIGPSGSWQDFSGSRAVNTDYVNDSGKNIAVSIGGTAGVATKDCELVINGVSVGRVSIASTFVATLFAIVPANATYRFNQVGAGTFSNLNWIELR